MLTIKPSLIRSLFVAALAGVSLFSQAKAASGQTEHRYKTILEASFDGTFAGELICVGQRPTCRNEKVVLRFEPIGQDGSQILMFFDLVQGSLRLPIVREQLQYNTRVRYFSGKFLTARDFSSSGDEIARAGTTFTYTITVTNNGSAAVDATISTQNNTVVRRIKLRRVKPNQVPPAPSSSSYPTF